MNNSFVLNSWSERVPVETCHKRTLLAGLLLGLLAVFCPLIHGQTNAFDTLVVQPHNTQVNLGLHSYFLEDKSRQLTLQDVSSADFDPIWQKSNGTSQNFSYTHSAYWFMVELDHATLKQPWLLLLDNPSLAKVQFYEVTQGQVLQDIISGFLVNVNLRTVAHRKFIFPLKLIPSPDTPHYSGAPPRTTRLYLRVETQTPMKIPLILWQQDAFYENDQHSLLGMGVYYGVMLVIMIYNLALFLSIRHTSYLYFTLFIAFNSLLQAIIDGLAFQHLWPNHPTWGNIIVVIVMPLDFMFIWLFTYKFFDLKIHYPSLAIIAKGGVAGCLLLLLLGLIWPYSMMRGPLPMASLLTYISVLFMGFYISYKGQKEAIIFSLAWSSYLLGSAVFVLAFVGVLPSNYWTINAAPIALIILVNLLSFALAYRFNLEKRAKQDAQLSAQAGNSRALMAQEAQRHEQHQTRLLQQLSHQKTHFFQSISHELRTPLTLILNPLDTERLSQITLAAQEGGPAPSVNVEVAAKNARRLLRLVNQLLDFQKLSANKMQLTLAPLGVEEFVRVSGTYFQSFCASKGTTFTLTLDGQALTPQQNNVYIHANLDALEKVVFNFLSNALKFTPQNGQIELGIQRLTGSVRIFVRNSGMGISPTDQTQLFKIFSRLDDSATREYEGTGLGLALAKQLTDTMDGKIGVDSVPEKGSTFWCEFAPCPPPKENIQQAFTVKDWLLDEVTPTNDNSSLNSNANASASPDNTNNLATTGFKILVIDDLPDMRTLISHRLHKQGHDIITANDGVQGLTQVQEQQPDLIVCDWMMPNMSGPELIAILKAHEQWASIPVVLLTAKSDAESKMLGVNVGADAFLSKPFNEQELVSTVRNLLQLKSRERTLQHTLNTLQTTQSALIQTEKMTALGQLLVGLAQELTPLLNLGLNANHDLSKQAKQLREDFNNKHLTHSSLNEFLQQYSTLANRGLAGLQQAALLVKHFKEISVELAGFECLNFLMKDELALLSSAFTQQINERGLTLQFNCADDLSLYSYPVAIRQLLIILFSNALEHGFGPADNGTITLTVSHKKEDVIIDYQDDGKGMSQQILDNIFTPFFSAEHTGQSPGLGMYIAHNIVSLQLQGTITCQSTVGTRITITIPRVLNHNATSTVQLDTPLNRPSNYQLHPPAGPV
jgi:signal transduction histidine kinase